MERRGRCGENLHACGNDSLYDAVPRRREPEPGGGPAHFSVYQFEAPPGIPLQREGLRDREGSSRCRLLQGEGRLYSRQEEVGPTGSGPPIPTSHPNLQPAKQYVQPASCARLTAYTPEG